MNDGDACYQLGAVYEEGQRVEQDGTKAKQLFSKACNEEVSEACDKAKEFIIK